MLQCTQENREHSKYLRNAINNNNNNIYRGSPTRQGGFCPIVLQGKSQSGVRKLNRKQER